jgi:hypothetical protein
MDASVFTWRAQCINVDTADLKSTVALNNVLVIISAVCSFLACVLATMAFFCPVRTSRIHAEPHPHV